MPSSTSSSRAPSSILIAVAIGCALGLGVFAGWELWLRSQGLLPDMDNDDLQLWASNRQRLATDRPDQVIFVGTSRMIAGIDGDVADRLVPEGDWIQLAIIGGDPIDVLEDVFDSGFRGIVVADLFHRELRSVAHYVRYFHDDWDHWNWAAHLDFWMARHINGRLTAKSSRFTLVRHLQRSWFGIPHLKSRTAFRFDRANTYDYSLPYWAALIEPERAVWVRRAQEWYADPSRERALMERFATRMAALAPKVARFQQRGGRFVGVRVPTRTPGFPTHERDTRAPGWDAWAEGFPGLLLHFLDVPGMRDIDTPDATHMDRTGATQFTTALLEELRARGVFQAR